MKMPNIKICTSLLSLAVAATPCFAYEGVVPAGMPKLDHVFVIVMENHSYEDIRNNVTAPFINGMADKSAVASNYVAIGHPSLTNYLEMVGGSNFNVFSDNSPDWHSTSCTPFTDTGAVCPIDGLGTETSTGTAFIVGKSIADQLDSKKLSWKNYQQSLPLSGANGVNVSDGFYSNLTDFTSIIPVTDPVTTNDDMRSFVVQLYAVKHNPFVYFKTGQQSASLQKTVGFEGDAGLYADLRAGKVPNFSFIVPNQCNDQHGAGGAELYCGYGPSLIERGDQTVARIVTAIKNSKAWKNGNNVIILTWDEDDNSASNHVLTVVDTNRGDTPSVSSAPYNHYALLKTLEAGFRLPCLNHACDADVHVMGELFTFKGKHQ
jgi:phosphatidylinositol-3-phosphatase